MKRGGIRLGNRRPGRTREKLAEMITVQAKSLWGNDFYIEPENLYRNNPCYINLAKDGVSWDGHAKKEGSNLTRHVYSYSSMGLLVKHGFKLLEDGECMSLKGFAQ
jgi:hypothetical protein